MWLKFAITAAWFAFWPLYTLYLVKKVRRIEARRRRELRRQFCSTDRVVASRKPESPTQDEIESCRSLIDWREDD